MEKQLNEMILACENCVTKTVTSKHNMNECVRICSLQELLCKTLKVAIKNKADKNTIKSLKEACLHNLKKCHEICSQHKEKHCIQCAKQSGILIEVLSK